MTITMNHDRHTVPGSKRSAKRYAPTDGYGDVVLEDLGPIGKSPLPTLIGATASGALFWWLAHNKQTPGWLKVISWLSVVGSGLTIAGSAFVLTTSGTSPLGDLQKIANGSLLGCGGNCGCSGCR